MNLGGLFFTFLLFTSTQVWAKKVTLNDLIQNIKHQEIDIELTAPKPFINSVQLRTQDRNAYREGDIDLELRFSTENLEEYKTKRQLYANQKERKKIIQKISLGDKLNKVINLYITLNLGRKKSQLLKNLEVLNKDKVTVLKKMVSKGLANATDYIQAIEKYEMSQFVLKNQEIQNKALVSSINGLLGTDYKLRDFAKNEKLLSLDYMKKKMRGAQNEIEGLEVKLTKFQQERIDLETKLDYEKESKILDFVAIEFNQNQLPNSDEFDDFSQDEKRLSVNFAINLPFLDSNMKRSDNTMDSFLKKRKAREDYIASKSGMTILKGSVQNLINGVSKLEKSRSVREAKRYLRIYSKRKGTSPLKLLVLNEFLIDAELKLNEYKSELYINFYKYMFEIGKLDFENGRLVLKG